MPVIDMIKTGNKIQMLRKAFGMSVKDVQEACGLGSTYAVYKWQNGQTLPSIDNLVVLSKLFQTTMDDLIVIK